MFAGTPRRVCDHTLRFLTAFSGTRATSIGSIRVEGKQRVANILTRRAENVKDNYKIPGIGSGTSTALFAPWSTFFFASPAARHTMSTSSTTNKHFHL